MSKWVRCQPGQAFSWEERRPYEECPNCGRYEYRKVRLLHHGIIRTWILKRDPYYSQQKVCKNCHYSTEMESVPA